MVDLGTLGGIPARPPPSATAGRGHRRDQQWDRRAFSWTQAGGMVNLGTLGGFPFSYATAVSNGQVVGFAYTSDGAAQRFQLTPGGGMVDWARSVGLLARHRVSNGQVVGTAETSRGDRRASAGRRRGMVNLGSSAGATARPTPSATGQVVGYAYTAVVRATPSAGHRRRDGGPGHASRLDKQ